MFSESPYPVPRAASRYPGLVTQFTLGHLHPHGLTGGYSVLNPFCSLVFGSQETNFCKIRIIPRDKMICFPMCTAY